MTQRPQRSFRKPAARLLAVGVGLLLAGLLVVSSAAALTGDEEHFRVTGELPLPAEERRSGGQVGSVVHIDAERRRLYYSFADRSAPGGTQYTLVEYDLEPDIPVPLRETVLTDTSTAAASPSPWRVAVDEGRQRMLLSLTFPRLNPSALSMVWVVNLDEFEVEAQWNLAQVVPGFDALGITYSPDDELVYLVGDWSGSWAASFLAQAFGRVVGPVTTVVALTPDGELAWVRPIPQCQLLVQQGTAGTLIARSAHLPALYFFCSDGRFFGAGGAGQPGLVRFEVPPVPTQASVAAARVDFFPAPGIYDGPSNSDNGVMTFDPVSDRVFAASQSRTTPAVWVFDGRREAWVGSIALRAAGHRWMGINRANGKFYVAGVGQSAQSPALRVTDGWTTPLPQGIEDRSLGFGDNNWQVVQPPMIDPATGRVFVGITFRSSPDEAMTANAAWLVLEDRTEPIRPPSPEDLDALTADVEEGEDTSATFTGGVRSFGSRVTEVGGLDGPFTGVGGGFDSITSLVSDRLATRRGDRGIAAGRISGLELANFGAGVAAQSLQLDAASAGDLDEAGVDWPFERIECSDGGEGASSKDAGGVGASAEVRCDLGDEAVQAAASYGAQGTGTLSVAASGSTSQAWRDADRGAVTVTRASADGIELASPAGTLSIGRVGARVETVAAGRTGTSAARWVRQVDGVVVRDADGDQLFPPEGVASCVTVIAANSDDESREAGSCDALADGINQVLQNAVQVRFPTAEVQATPRGAFAEVARTETDAARALVNFNDDGREAIAMEAVLYADGAEKVRGVVELAGITANSIYTISQFPTFDPPPAPRDDGADDTGRDDDAELGQDVTDFLTGTDATDAFDAPTGAGEPLALEGGLAGPALDGTDSPPEVALDDDDSTPATSARGGLASGLARLIRTPLQAALVAGLWLLFTGAVGAVIRRSLLLRALSD